MAKRPNPPFTRQTATTPAARMLQGPPQPEVLEPGQTAKPKRAVKPLKVRATQTGYYGEARRRPGDVFVLADGDKDFSATWMEEVDPRTREHTTGAGAALAQAHDELLGGSVQGRDPQDVFGDDDK